MAREISAQFDDPGTAATYLGESIGTHYSAALRAAEAYGRHLAATRESLLTESFDGQGLRNFWLDLIRSEQVRLKSPNVLKNLSTTTSHYFQDFLDTADAVYGRQYMDVTPEQRKKIGQTEHAKCLRILRDHSAEGLEDHFAVQNRVSTWMQLIRVTRRYQE